MRTGKAALGHETRHDIGYSFEAKRRKENDESEEMMKMMREYDEDDGDAEPHRD